MFTFTDAQMNVLIRIIPQQKVFGRQWTSRKIV